MSSKKTPPQPTASSSQAASPPSLQEPFAQIVALARAATSRSRFMKESLRCIARHFKSPYAAVHVRYTSEVLQDDCHFGNGDPAFWKDSLQGFLTDALAQSQPLARLLRSKKGKSHVAFLSTPVFDASGRPHGAIAVVVYGIDEGAVTPALTKLDSLVRLASFSAEFIGTQAGASGTTTSRSGAQAQSHAAACETTAELAFTITNELRNKMGCEQVALGMVRHGHVRILSISGLDEVRHQSPGVVSLTGAMEECLDAGESIAYQRDGGWSGDGIEKAFRFHKHWHAMAKGDGVASVPLRSRSHITAILSLRQSADRPLTAEHLEEIRKRVEPYAAALQLTERANRGLMRHGNDSIREIGSSIMETGRWGRRAGVLVMLLFSGWFALGSVSYDLAVDAVVTAAEMKHVAAPFDGVIVGAEVSEGDSIQAGQVLYRLDDREPGQQRAQLLAELEVWERTMDKARADDQPFEVQLARAKRTLTQTKLDMVERRIEQATIRAPFAGVVVAGDLRKRIGGVALRGEALFEIAPLDRWTLELHVPDAVSADLSADLQGVFTSYARPDRSREFRIARVLASAQHRKSANVFIAEADLDGRAPWIRPGMEGLARVHVGRRPVWWVAMHRVIDYLRINFWV